jgi:multiple sugar transport system permease protein
MTVEVDHGRTSVQGLAGGSHKPRFGRGVAWLMLILLLVVSLFPFYWAFRTAISDNSLLLSGEQTLAPIEPTTYNFERVLGIEPLESGGSATFDFWNILLNTVLVATFITIGQVWFSAMAAYAFARLKWKGRDAVFYLYLTGLMIPPIITLIPNFILIRNLNLINTLTGIILPFFLMTPFAVFFLRQFFLGLNRNIEEAAFIDGAGHFAVFFRVVMPMAAAPMFTLGILTYITAWNEFLWPLVVGREESKRVFTVALNIFTSQLPGSSPDWTGLMAAAMLSAAPVIALFLIFGRRVVDSIQFSGIK